MKEVPQCEHQVLTKHGVLTIVDQPEYYSRSEHICEEMFSSKLAAIHTREMAIDIADHLSTCVDASSDKIIDRKSQLWRVGLMFEHGEGKWSDGTRLDGDMYSSMFTNRMRQSNPYLKCQQGVLLPELLQMRAEICVGNYLRFLCLRQKPIIDHQGHIKNHVLKEGGAMTTEELSKLDSENHVASSSRKDDEVMMEAQMEDDEEGGLGVEGTILVVCICILALIIFILLFAQWRRKKRKSERSWNEHVNTNNTGSNTEVRNVVSATSNEEKLLD